MNIVDSSAWLEYFANSGNAKNFEKIIENKSKLLVPTVILYEVFKKILLERDKNSALTVLAYMQQGEVVDINAEIAINAAKLSKDHKLPMADSLIYAIAQKHNAIIWTQDADFENLPNVKYFPKK